MKVQAWARVFLVLAAAKAAYHGLLFLALWGWADLDLLRFRGVFRTWPLEGGPDFTTHYGAWDGAHYLYLSTRGYAAGVNSRAFYPLWPLVVRGVSALTGGSHLMMGLVLANLFSLGGWTLFHRVVAGRFGEVVATRALVLMVLFPGSLFFQFPYSEALFFLLVMLLWSGLERGWYGLAWVAAVLLPLTRGVGVFLVLPLGWHWLVGRGWGWLDRLAWVRAERARMGEPDPASGGPGGWGHGHRVGAGSWAAMSLPLAPVLGWGVYLGLMWLWTGNPFEGVDAQRHWSVHSIGNLWDLPKFVMGFFEPTNWHDFRGSVLDRCAFLLLLYCLPVIWRLGKDMVLWTYVLGILPAMSGTFTSFVRFESTAFPLFIALAVFLSRLKAGWPLWVVAIASGLLQVVLLWRFVNFRWAG